MLEQSFISYITDFAKNAPDSQPVPWYDNYFKPLNKAPYKEEDFRSIKNKDFNIVWPKLEHTLTRNDLFKFFDEKSDESLYKGYVATMLWGGIGTGGGSKDNLINAMSQPKSEIIERIREIKKVLGSGKENEVKAAFIMMTKKYGTKFNFEGKKYSGAKIPGIDISYFTKLLFFLGKKDWECQPLVYDNQLQNVHCALLKDSGIGVQSLFDIHSFKMDSSTISCRISLRNGDLAKPVDFYIDFIKRVKSLSESIELSRDCKFQGKAGRLEEIMFGEELSREKDPRKNPRAFVKNYLGLTEYGEEQGDPCDSVDEGSTTTASKSSERMSNNASAAGDIKNVDTLISELKKKYSNYRFDTNKSLPTGNKAIISCEISDGITLAVGEKKTFIFCGVYSKSSNTVLPYMNDFNIQVKNGRYKKFETNHMEQALNQFSAILDAEIAKKSN